MTKQEAQHILNGLTPAQKAKVMEQIQLHKGLACLGAARVVNGVLLRYVESTIKDEPPTGGIQLPLQILRHKSLARDKRR